jgi:hypothetical protein
MKIIGWLILAGIGMGVSIWAYGSGRPAEGSTSISSGVIVVARSSSQRFDEPIPFPSTKAGVLQLPVSGISAMLAMSSGGHSDAGRSLRFQLSEKLIRVSLEAVGITERSLAWGKLPRIGKNEVLAGQQATHKDQFEVSEIVYTVTGGLPREAGLFARSYVLAEIDRTGEHGDEGDASFRPGLLIPLTPEQLAKPSTREQLQNRFPMTDRVVCLPSTPPLAFYVYLLGEAIFLLGGAGALISLYAAGASRVRWGILRDPLLALSTHRRLNWGVHLTYFGLCLATAGLVYQAPDLWNAMQAVIRGALSGGDRTLEFAGKAYLSGNFAWAALVTFAINFFLGSLVFLTLPSCIIPGSGALAAAYRAALWGILLAPATLQQAYVMLPHSGTLLLEGEGYILATFFGLMLAVHVFRPDSLGLDPASNFSSRYGRGLLLNLKGSLLVALVLAVAAIYEAVEVILLLKSTGGA